MYINKNVFLITIIVFLIEYIVLCYDLYILHGRIEGATIFENQGNIL
jgi:hypothetical protein